MHVAKAKAGAVQCTRASYIHPDTLEHLTTLAVSYIPT